MPGRQAEALRGAFGMTQEAVADRFLVGLGVLSLAAARDEPGGGLPGLPGLPELQVDGLDREAAGQVLAAAGGSLTDLAAAERAGLVRVTSC